MYILGGLVVSRFYASIPESVISSRVLQATLACKGLSQEFY